MGVTKHVNRILKQAHQQREIWSHRLAHGGAFQFNGRPVVLPAGTKLGLRHAIVTGDYEAPERNLIERYLSPTLPVIELGGCLGLVSGFISNQLEPDVDHIVVEANPDLLDACRANARANGRSGKTNVIQKAIAYGKESVAFHKSGNAHVGRIGDAAKPGNIEVAACGLADIVAQLDTDGAFSLVCDIEGGEYDLFQRDVQVLKRCALAIVEVHPDVFDGQGRSLEQFLDLVSAAGFQQVDRDADVYAFQRV